jgi:hypothetical protein
VRYVFPHISDFKGLRQFNAGRSPDHPSRDDQVVDPLAEGAHASIGRLVEAFDEVLDLSQHLLIPHGIGRLVDAHHHGPLEMGDGAGYCVQTLERLTSPGAGGSSPTVPS